MNAIERQNESFIQLAICIDWKIAHENEAGRISPWFDMLHYIDGMTSYSIFLGDYNADGRQELFEDLQLLKKICTEHACAKLP